MDEKRLISLLQNKALGQKDKEAIENTQKDLVKYKNQLDRITSHSDKLEKQLRRVNGELNEYKNELEKKVNQEIEMRKEKEKMLFAQSKLAAMGEMMDAVAHQWKQPINVLKMQIDMLGYDFMDTDIESFQMKTKQQIEHMVSTLDEFRSFLRPSKHQKLFRIKHCIDSALLLLKDQLIKNQIETKLDQEYDFEIKGVENEFIHLLINIINNAIDAFNENKTKDRLITFTTCIKQNKKQLIIKDNAGGIPQSVLPNIFKANITSKPEGKGTGIGLYMSDQIASKHNGRLYAYNSSSGAVFVFEQKS